MKLPTYFISHGGGPWPYMEDMRKTMHVLEASLVDMPRQLPYKPKAILMISAHWEESAFKVMTSPWPGMLYDYGGFPEHTYKVHYSAPGSPELAERVMGLIKDAGLPAQADAQRGFDHGAFAPLAVMYPEADMPVVQLSLRKGLDPAEHLALGRALAPLRDEGILIIGSGLSYHNLRRFGPLAKEPSSSFDDWLQDSLIASSTTERVKRLLNWEEAPAARVAHPREEHLLPLMVAVGAAEDEVASCVYHEENIFGGVVASSFRFGAIA
ncbi:DODA-type extradiol aromatic ring-opening family dioxygenase [Undibacterium sp. Tian12W]|uniref:DODA-type extradiol aromatic ring-opening family dioxygenase n=1 Tax=Undibacterium sp. Tian12W TaxID=3413054 RepID=UPI003BF258FE